MDLDDIMDKAKDAVENVSDDQIDMVEGVIKSKTGDSVDGIVDKAADLARGLNKD